MNEDMGGELGPQPCQPIGCDNGFHLPGCVFAEVDGPEVSIWGSLHAGDVVLGVDGQTWGVVELQWRGPTSADVDRSRVTLVITLYRLGVSVVGYPHPGDAVSVVARADTRAEEAAYAVLMAAGLQPEVVSETWES